MSGKYIEFTDGKLVIKTLSKLSAHTGVPVITLHRAKNGCSSGTMDIEGEIWTFKTVYKNTTIECVERKMQDRVLEEKTIKIYNNHELHFRGGKLIKTVAL